VGNNSWARRQTDDAHHGDKCPHYGYSMIRRSASGCWGAGVVADQEMQGA
jgi:hypothetical protein